MFYNPQSYSQNHQPYGQERTWNFNEKEDIPLAYISSNRYQPHLVASNTNRGKSDDSALRNFLRNAKIPMNPHASRYKQSHNTRQNSWEKYVEQSYPLGDHLVDVRNNGLSGARGSWHRKVRDHDVNNPNPPPALPPPSSNSLLAKEMNFKYAQTFEGWATHKDAQALRSKKTGDKSQTESLQKKRDRELASNEAFQSWLKERGNRKIMSHHAKLSEEEKEKEEEKENHNQTQNQNPPEPKPWRKFMKTRHSNQLNSLQQLRQQELSAIESEEKRAELDALFMEWLSLKEVQKKKEEKLHHKKMKEKIEEKKKIREKKWLKKVVISQYKGEVASNMVNTSLNYIR